VGKEAVPKAKGKGDVNRCKRGDGMVLKRANTPFGKNRTVVVGGGKLHSHICSWVGEIRPEGRGRFIVRDDVRDDVADRLEK
jgi:hypothetical protein